MKQLTKILGLGILFLFLASMQLSAQKCKYDYDKKDPITGEISKGIAVAIELKGSYALPGNATKSEIGFNKNGETYFISFKITFFAHYKEFIRKGEPLMIKLSNGEFITINAQDEFIPSHAADQVGVYTTYSANYNIDAVSFQKLTDSPPTFVRVNFENRIYDREITDKVQKKLYQAAKCILQ